MLWHARHRSVCLGPTVGDGEDKQRNRPKIFSTSNNDLIAMFNYGAEIVFCGATAAKDYTDWQELHRESGPWSTEPLFDLTRWREDGILSIYAQRDPSANMEPTALYVLDFQLTN